MEQEKHGRGRAIALWSGLVALLAALAFAFLRGEDDAPPPPEPPDAPLSLKAPARLGMNASELAADLMVGSSADDAHLARMKSIGIQEVRLPAVWSSIDPTGTASSTGAFQWAAYHDQMVTALASAGLRWYPTLGYTPASLSSAPDHPAGGNPSGTAVQGALPTFVAALVGRYGVNGGFWQEHPELAYLPIRHLEAWNEPNLAGGTWEPNDSDSEQAEQTMDLYNAVRRGARAVDPAITVVFPSLAPLARDEEVGEWSDPVEFLRRAREHSDDPVDAVGYHPYVTYIAAKGALGAVEFHLRRLRAGMREIGLGKTPIEVTELGFATSSESFLPPPDGEVELSEEERTRHYRDAIEELRLGDCGVSAIFPLTWFGAEPAAGGASGDADALEVAYEIAEVFAIAERDATLKPSGEAVAEAYAAQPRRTRVCG